MKSGTERVLAYASGVIALGLSCVVFQEFRLIGFPDGFLSDYDRLRKIVLSSSIVAGVVSSLWFVSLGWIAERKRIGLRFCLTGILFAALALSAFLIDHHLSQLSGHGG